MLRRHFSIIMACYCLMTASQAASSLAEIEQQISVGQYYKALASLDELLKQDRQNPQYQFNRALALAASGQQDKAIDQYRELIKAYPDLPEAYNNLAVIYLEQGKTEQARKTLEQAMQAHAGYAAVYKNLRALNAAAGRDAYARALQIPAKKAVQLDRVEQLVLQTAALKMARPAPVSASNATQRYQATNPPADKKNDRQENQASNSQQAFAKASEVLHGWAKAWSEKNVEQYLQYYSSDYSPPGMSRKYWQNQRRVRIRKPSWIRVKLRNLQLQNNQAGRLVIRLEQEYSADKYSDVSRKEFVMSMQNGEWRIIKERGLGYVRQ